MNDEPKRREDNNGRFRLKTGKVVTDGSFDTREEAEAWGSWNNFGQGNTYEIVDTAPLSQTERDADWKKMLEDRFDWESIFGKNSPALASVKAFIEAELAQARENARREMAAEIETLRTDHMDKCLSSMAPCESCAEQSMLEEILKRLKDGPLSPPEAPLK
jgi:hypothetical protein